MTFHVGGSQRVLVDSSGNVGIATATADEKLHLNGRMVIEDTVAPGVTENKLYSVSGDLFWAGVEISQDSDSIQNTQDGADTTSITTAAVSDTIVMTTNSTEALRIDSNQDVGIGTNAPSSRLHVEDDTTDPILLVKPNSTNGFDGIVEIQGARRDSTVNDEAQLYFSNYDENKASPQVGNLGMIGGHVTNNVTNVGDLVFYNYPTGQDVDKTRTMTLTKDSFVGIGVTVPTERLDVDGNLNLTDGNQFNIDGNLILSETTLGSSVVNSSLTSVGTLNTLTVSGDVTVDTNVLKVDTTNNRVGINSANPTKELDVNGDALLQGGELCLVDTNEKIASDGTSLMIDVGGVERFRIESNGDVGIGVSASYKLDVGGDANLADGSDYRIDGNSILNETTLGSSVVNSSLTSVGNLVDLTVDGDVVVGVTQFVIDVSESKVGIGSATPTKELDVVGDAVLQGGVLCLFNADEKIQSDGSEMTFHVGNSERMVIASDGKLGVGVLSPTYQLDVAAGDANLASGDYRIGGTSVLNATTLGSGVVNSSLTSVGTLTDLTVAGDLLVDTNTLYVDSTNDAVMVGITEAASGSKFHVHNDSGNTLLVMSNNNTGATNADGFQITVENTGNSDVCIENQEVNGDIKFVLDGTNVMYMDGSNDFIGIGVNDPDQKLEVNGNVKLSNASDSFRIDTAEVLNQTTLGSTVVNSSLTSVGTLTSLTVSGTSNLQGVTTIGSDLNVNGDLTVTGTTTTVDTQTLTVEDPMIKLASGNTGNVLDIGFYGHYVETGTTYFTGMVKDSSVDKYFLFDGATSEPGVTQVENLTMAYVTFDTANDRVGLGLGVTAPSKGLDVGGSALLQGGELCLVDADDKIASDGTDMTFHVGGSERAKLDASGNLGIGKTAAAGNKLDVDGDANLSATYDYEIADVSVLNATTLGSGVVNSSLTNFGVVTTLNVSGDSGFGFTGTGTHHVTIGDADTGLNGEGEDELAVYTGGVERMRFDSAGQVGIGNVDPVENLQLHEASSANSIMKFTNTTTGATASDGFDIGLDADENAVLNQQEANSMIFYTSNAQRMEIDASGNVGMGTAAFTIDQDLHVEKSQSGADVGAKISNTSDTAGSDAVLELVVGGTSGGDPHVHMEVPSGSTWTMGVDNSAADNLTFGTGAVGSSPYMVIETAGNVGVGTTNPEQLLDVNGIGAFRTSLAVGGNFTPSSIDLAIGDANTGLHGAAEDELQILTGGSERMRFDASGNVGIGGVDPTVDLHLEKSTDSGDVSQIISNTSTTGQADALLHIETASAGSGDPHLELSTNANTWSLGVDHSDSDKLKLGLGAVGSNQLMVVDLNGDVGIGTDSPNNRFVVADGGSASRAITDVAAEVNVTSNHAFMLLEARTATDDAGVMFYVNGTDNAAIWMDESANLLRFATGGVETNANRETNTKMTIDADNGNVAIGIAESTLAKLYVNGVGSASSVSYGFLNSSGSTGTNGPASESYSIGASGQVRATEFHAISDRRVKKNLQESNYQEDMDTLSNLKTYSYDYIDQKFEKKETRKGMIAQEVEQVYPKAVKQCVDYIPNIYKVCENVSADGKTIQVEFEENEDIKVGSFVKVMLYRIEDDQGEVAEFEIENVGVNQLSLTTAIDLNKYYGELFVIGTRVEDFRNISNDDISNGRYLSKIRCIRTSLI
jgi:hypothetical protein